MEMKDTKDTIDFRLILRAGGKKETSSCKTAHQAYDQVPQAQTF